MKKYILIIIVIGVVLALFLYMRSVNKKTQNDSVQTSPQTDPNQLPDANEPAEQQELIFE